MSKLLSNFSDVEPNDLPYELSPISIQNVIDLISGSQLSNHPTQYEFITIF